ncbi:MAG TPA: GntR family transcriptional regulator [Propionibacterium sp.]|nr:GntR family transcriptional regulator [Propionibacterium sp.]
MRFEPGSRVAVIGGRLAHQVYDDLKQQLLTGVHQPGSALIVSDLCRDFGVSKQPVMEALRALAADRLVEIQPQVGVRVRDFNAAEIEGFLWVFSRCEGVMAHRAAQFATEDEMDELAGLCERLERLEASPTMGNQLAYRHGNREVHSLIHSMGRSQLAADISYDLFDLSDFLIVTHGGGFSGRLPERNRGHREVLDAIRRRDPEAAEQAMRSHILSSPLGRRA